MWFEQIFIFLTDFLVFICSVYALIARQQLLRHDEVLIRELFVGVTWQLLNTD